VKSWGKWTDEQKAEMVDAYKAGESTPRIAKRFKTTPGSIRSILRRLTPLDQRKTKRAARPPNPRLGATITA
jgi:transposase-like protein